jgi:hypothetical protein
MQSTHIKTKTTCPLVNLPLCEQTGIFPNNAKIVNVTNEFMHREIAKGKSLSAEEENVYGSVVYIPKQQMQTYVSLTFFTH